MAIWSNIDSLATNINYRRLNDNDRWTADPFLV